MWRIIWEITTGRNYCRKSKLRRQKSGDKEKIAGLSGMPPLEGDEEKTGDLSDMPTRGDEEVKEGKWLKIMTPNKLLTWLPVQLA